MYEIKKEKDALREIYSKKRKEISRENKEIWDKKICDYAISLVSFRHAETVLLYAPKDDEINVRRIAEEAWARGKEVAFPLCDSEKCRMTYRVVKSFDELKKGTYGIMEPSADAPEYDKSKLAICFVPALLFDREGYRLGYGKGYYDRFLNHFSGSYVGLVYSDFIIDFVPRGRFDLSIKVQITEKGVKTSK